MGNQLSNESGAKGPSSTFGRRGALGLNKSELEKRCAPSGLYPSCHWDDKAIRRLIGDGRLAARLKGNDTRKSVSDQECPICFLHFSQTNVTQCCKANICTECFLQVRPQREKHSVCPFCNHPKLFVAIAKQLDSGEIQERETKEQAVIEASIRARAQGEDLPPIDASAKSNRFGSSLNQNDIVRRARSRTMSSGGEGDVPNKAGGAAGLNGVNDDVHLLQQLSLSSDDRQTLEQEMRAQHTHPLALQMEAEAQERRQNNELEYYRNNPQRSRDTSLVRARVLGAPNGDVNGSLLNRFARANSASGRSGRRWNGDFGSDANSLDDMVVLEAALMLSMEEARSQGTSSEGRVAYSDPPSSQRAAEMHKIQQISASDSNIGGSRRKFRGSTRTASLSALVGSSAPSFPRGVLSEDDQVAMAIAISMQEQKDSSHGSNEEGSDKGDSKPEARRSTGGKTPPESAPPKSAISSAQSSSGVASLPIVSEDDGDSSDDNEEEIIFSKPSPNVTGKSSPGDRAYFRALADGGDSADNRKEISD